MKILMLGWDFAPFFSKGLDCLSYEMLNNFHKNKFEVSLVLPYSYKNNEAVELTELKPAECETEIKNKEEEIDVYTSRAGNFFRKKYFDAVYCNRWLAYRAAINAKKISGKPLVIHVRDTVFNREFDSLRYNEEKEAFKKADRIIVSSESLKMILNKKYGIQKSRIKLINLSFNIDNTGHGAKNNVLLMGGDMKQKDMEYFARIAKNAVSYMPDINFIVASAGDNLKILVGRAMDFKIADRIKYIKCSTKNDLKNIISKSGIAIIPNASDSALNLALINSGIPSVVDRNSGIQGKFNNIIVSDLWNVMETSSKIVSLAKHDELFEEIKSGISKELKNNAVKETEKEIKEVFEFG